MVRCSTKDVRERLLDAGVRTFSKSGFNGCSVQDITDAASVPKGSFYNHFESKEALGVAALDHYWTDATCSALRVLDETDLPPLLRLRRYFERIADDMASKDFTCGCLAANMAAELSDHSPAISAQLSAVFAAWTARVAECLRAAQAAGDLAAEHDPTILAGFLLNAWEGALLRTRIGKSDQPLRQFVDILFTRLLR